MNVALNKILDQIEQPDIDFLRQYMDKVATNADVRIQETAKVGSEIYLALTLKSAIKDLDNAINRMTESNENLARANEKYAIASNRHADSLKRATWALVGATVLLAIVAGMQVYLTYLSLG